MSQIRILWLAALVVGVSSLHCWAQTVAFDASFFSIEPPAGYTPAAWDQHHQILFAPEIQDTSFRLIFVFYCSTEPGAPEPDACDKSEEEWIAWWEAGRNSRQPLPNKFQKREGTDQGSTEYFTDGIGTARDGGATPYFAIRGVAHPSGRVMVYGLSRASARDAANLADSVRRSIRWRPNLRFQPSAGRSVPRGG